MSQLNRPHIDSQSLPEPVTYRGFVIDRHFGILKDGIPKFTARWQACWSLQEAKDLIDASLAKKALQSLPSLSNYSPMMLLDEDEQRERDWQAMEEKLEQYYTIENEQL